MKKFLILAAFAFFCIQSNGGHGYFYPGGMYWAYPYWSEWGYYWVYQYPNGFQPYGVFPDTRKNLLQGKIFNNDEPKKGSKKVGKMVLGGKVF